MLQRAVPNRKSQDMAGRVNTNGNGMLPSGYGVLLLHVDSPGGIGDHMDIGFEAQNSHLLEHFSPKAGTVCDRATCAVSRYMAEDVVIKSATLQSTALRENTRP